MKKILIPILVFSLLVVPSVSSAAIALDSAGAQFASGTSPLTFSHTVTGSNTILLVGFLGTGNPDADITSVTYNGVAMTQAVENLADANEDVYIYYLVNPATGANNVQISWSGTHTIAGRAYSLTGAKQSAQPDASNSGSTGAGTSVSVSVTTVADSSLIAGFARAPEGGNIGAGANTTERTDDADSATTWLEYTSNPKTPAGAQATIATLPASQRLVYVVVSVSPAVTEAAGVGRSRSGNRFVGTGISR